MNNKAHGWICVGFVLLGSALAYSQGARPPVTKIAKGTCSDCNPYQDEIWECVHPYPQHQVPGGCDAWVDLPAGSCESDACQKTVITSKSCVHSGDEDPPVNTCTNIRLATGIHAVISRYNSNGCSKPDTGVVDAEDYSDSDDTNDTWDDWAAWEEGAIYFGCTQDCRKSTICVMCSVPTCDTQGTSTLSGSYGPQYECSNQSTACDHAD